MKTYNTKYCDHKKIMVKRSLLLLLCMIGLWGYLLADDVSEDTVVSESVRYDSRMSVGGRLLRGIERISPVAENENANARLTVNGEIADGWSVESPLFDSTQKSDDWHDFALNEGKTIAEAKLLVLNNENIIIHGGALMEDETWEAGKIHVVHHWVRIPQGMTLTVETDEVN